MIYYLYIINYLPTITSPNTRMSICPAVEQYCSNYCEKVCYYLGLCSALGGFLHTSLFELKLFNSFPDYDIFPKLRHFYWYDSGRMGVWPVSRGCLLLPISDYCNSPNLLCAYLIFFFWNFFWTLFIYTTLYHQGCQSCKCKKNHFYYHDLF